MTFKDTLQDKVVEYLAASKNEWPRYVYLGEDQCKALDKWFGGLCFEVMNMEVIMVMKRCWLSFGE